MQDMEIRKTLSMMNERLGRVNYRKNYILTVRKWLRHNL